MSRVCRLSIQGIRNFDDESQPSTIKFSRPLTLIVGPNGTGKTTIIECLRYALSGEFPPGADNGKAFVHDPILKKSRCLQVRGKVMADIADCKGEKWTISRIIQVTRTNDKCNLKVLDSSISKIDKNTKTKIGHPRTGDINVEIMAFMGISKAILKYVLFCHQEDSNWPLEPGQKLKERFDEIFETTRYNKALDCIRKIMKDKKVEIKHLLREQQNLMTVVNEVKSKERKLEESKQRRDEAQKKIQDLTNKLELICNRLEQIREIEMKYSQWHSEDGKKEVEYKLAMQHMASLKENIKDLYEGSTETLINEIGSYDEILSGKNNEIEELERELQDSCDKETKISERIAERRVNVGTLRQQMRDEKAKVAQRNDALKNMVSVWNLNESIGTDVTPTDADKLINKFEERLRQLEQEVEEKGAEQDRELERLQRKVNNLRTERSTTESQLKYNESELVKTKAEIRTNQALLNQSGPMEQQLNEIDWKVDKANKRVEELEKKIDIDGLTRQIREATAEEEDYETKSNRVDKEITQLREQSSVHIKLASTQSELADKEKELEALREKHGDNLRMLLGKKNFCETNMTNTMNEVQEVLNKRVEKLKKEIELGQFEAMKLETSVNHKKQELEKKEIEMQSDKEKLSLYCKDYTNYKDVILLQSTKIKDLEDKRGVSAYQEAAYKEYIKKLTEPDPCCPLCHRGFQSSKDAVELAKELRNDTTRNPDRLKTYERDLAVQRKKYDALLQLQPIVDKIEKFETSEATKMRQEIDEAKKSLLASRQKIKRVQDALAEPESKLSICKAMIGDMALWERYSEEVEMLNVSIIEMQDQLRHAGLTTDKTMEEAETEQQELQQMLKKARNTIKSLQSTRDSHNEELRRATDCRTKILEEKLRIHKDLQDIKRAKSALEGLRVKEKKLTETIRQQEEHLVDVDDQLKVAVNNLERVKQDFRLQQESDRKVIREHSKDLDKLNSIHADVKKSLSRNIGEKLKVIEDQLESAERMAAKFKNERTARETKLSKMKHDIQFHNTAKRDLVDNLTLRRKEIEVEELKTARQELKKKLDSADWATLSKERKKLIERRDMAERERSKAQGNEEELEKNVADLTLELESDEYRLARSNYKDKCVELTVFRKCVDDLHIYSKVLDAAMIEYHEERMSTVNKIMKKLWGLIYKGTDTTSIQIRTEATTTNVDKRRQFNYKLVQIKHGAEMDMRGRCSAGQKVLASIILRLALAETFCEKCGVLALDEPTTNLDEENSKSLADALHKYVSIRKTERNFQLIVITHDENFIPQLSQLSSKNSYYELYRCPDGLSGIKTSAPEEDSSEDESNVGQSGDTKRRTKQSGEEQPRKKHRFE